jgi:hypothetical protein
MKEWVLTRPIFLDISKDIGEFLDRISTQLQCNADEYCFGFNVGIDNKGKPIIRFVELLVAYYYNLAREIRIIYWDGEQGTKEKVMSWDVFVEGLYKIEDNLFPRLAGNEKFTLGDKVVSNKPRRMFRLEEENALDKT